MKKMDRLKFNNYVRKQTSKEVLEAKISELERKNCLMKFRADMAEMIISRIKYAGGICEIACPWNNRRDYVCFLFMERKNGHKRCASCTQFIKGEFS